MTSDFSVWTGGFDDLGWVRSQTWGSGEPHSWVGAVLLHTHVAPPGTRKSGRTDSSHSNVIGIERARPAT